MTDSSIVFEDNDLREMVSHAMACRAYITPKTIELTVALHFDSRDLEKVTRLLIGNVILANFDGAPVVLTDLKIDNDSCSLDELVFTASCKDAPSRASS